MSKVKYEKKDTANWLNNTTYMKASKEIETWPKWKQEAYKRFFGMNKIDTMTNNNLA